MGPAEVEAAFRAGSVLGRLSAEARSRLAAAGAALELTPGALLFQAGDAGDAVYVVLTGEVEVRTHAADGRDLRHTALGPGALVGEMAALDGEARSADVTASRRTRLWRIPRAALLEALESDPKAAVALMVEFSRRLRAANEELQAATSLDLGGRLARLLAMAAVGGRISMTQTEMARRIGASREKVNRTLHAWAGEGLVEIGRSGVHVREARRLRRLFDPRA